MGRLTNCSLIQRSESQNIPQGTARMELWVGKCSGQTLGDAYTGWESVSRIMIEEVSRPSPNKGSLNFGAVLISLE